MFTVVNIFFLFKKFLVYVQRYIREYVFLFPRLKFIGSYVCFGNQTNKLKKRKRYLFTYVAPKSSRSSLKGVCAFRVEMKFGNVGFCGGRKTGEPGEKPSRRDENQQQTQPTYGVNPGNRSRTTWVVGDCSCHCATTVVFFFVFFFNPRTFNTMKPGTQRQNECACSSRVSNLTRQNGGIFKIPIACSHFAWISPNQKKGCRFQERFLRTSSITYLIQQKNIVVTGVNLAIEVEHS